MSNGTMVATYNYLPKSRLVGNVTFANSGTTRMTITRQYDPDEIDTMGVNGSLCGQGRFSAGASRSIAEISHGAGMNRLLSVQNTPSADAPMGFAYQYNDALPREIASTEMAFLVGEGIFRCCAGRVEELLSHGASQRTRVDTSADSAFWAYDYDKLGQVVCSASKKLQGLPCVNTD